MPSNSELAVASPPSLRAIFTVFFRIGAVSFGGGVVAYLRDELVTAQKWVDDEEFLAALEIGQTLPGLNSTNVAVIVGRHLRGPWGSVAAVTGLLIPGAILVMLLGVIYLKFRHDPQVTAVLLGVAAAAVGLLLQVTLKIGSKQLVILKDLAFVVAVFVLVGVFHVSLVVTLFTLAPLAIWLNRPPAPDEAPPAIENDGSAK